MGIEDKNQGVAAEFIGLDVKESIRLKTKILKEAREIKEQQKKDNNGGSTIEGGVYAGPSEKVLSGDYKKTLEDKSNK